MSQQGGGGDGKASPGRDVSQGDRSSNQAQGETHGRDQEPVEAGERDSVQREQASREGRPSGHDPAAPDAEVEDSLRMAHRPEDPA